MLGKLELGELDWLNLDWAKDQSIHIFDISNIQLPTGLSNLLNVLELIKSWPYYTLYDTRSIDHLQLNS